MLELHFSFIIPVYNRPLEIKELLESLIYLKDTFEVVIVEDGSQEKCEHVLKEFETKLKISYFYKDNTGPGDSRNYGMQKALGNYFIILDSDVIVPQGYLKTVRAALSSTYLDCYGGSDKSLDSFTDTQKAIDYAMTSIITTGGIRGSKQSQNSTSYEPRSFNMGISKAAFLESGGFGSIHPGEDPDLSIRLKKMNFEVGYIANAHVYHKRRTDFKKFAHQVHKFGLARPILISRYPESSKLTYWFPILYVLFGCLGLLLALGGNDVILLIYLIYNILIFSGAVFSYKSLSVAWLAFVATNIQFFYYGKGFIWSYYKICILKKDPELMFPKLFFAK